MRKRHKIVAGLVGAVLVAWWIGKSWPSQEPHYQGKPLSYWVQANARPVAPGGFDPQKAIAAIGSNAVPYLVKWSNRNSRAWQRQLRKYRNSNGLLHQWIPYGATGIDEENRAKAAMIAFRCLGPEGRSAIPYLTTWAVNPTNGFMASEAIEALCRMGPEASPVLLTLLSKGHLKSNPTIIKYLGESINPGAVPILLNCLAQTNGLTSWMAISALGNLKVEPHLVVPALIQRLEQTPRQRPQWEPDLRFPLVAALSEFGTNAAAATGLLLFHLDDETNDPAFSCLVMTTLRNINFQPETIVPALTHHLQSPESYVRRCAVQALSDLGPRAQAALPALTNALQFTDTRPQVAAAIRKIAQPPR